MANPPPYNSTHYYNAGYGYAHAYQQQAPSAQHQAYQAYPYTAQPTSQTQPTYTQQQAPQPSSQPTYDHHQQYYTSQISHLEQQNASLQRQLQESKRDAHARVANARWKYNEALGREQYVSQRQAVEAFQDGESHAYRLLKRGEGPYGYVMEEYRRRHPGEDVSGYGPGESSRGGQGGGGGGYRHRGSYGRA